MHDYSQFDITKEKLQQLLDLALALGGSVSVSTAKSIAKAPWGAIAESGHITADELAHMISLHYNDPQPMSIRRILNRIRTQVNR